MLALCFLSAVALSVFMKHENVAEKSRFQAFPHRRHKTRRRLFVPKLYERQNERTEAEDFPALKSYDNYAAVEQVKHSHHQTTNDTPWDQTLCFKV